jgi:dihydrofolate reductase
MKARADKDIYVIGGGEVYKALLAYCEEVLVTKVDAVGGAEVFFPNLDKDERFTLVYQSEEIEDNGYAIRFTTYKNRAVAPL